MTDPNEPDLKISKDDELWAALARVADQAAAKTAMPLVVPVREIMAAVHAVYDDVPRVPAVNPELLKGRMAWSAPQEYVPHKVPDGLPDYIALFVADRLVHIDACPNGDHSQAVCVALPPAMARDFFLNGLAACLLAEQQERARLAEMAKQPLDLSAIPEEVFKQGELAAEKIKED